MKQSTALLFLAVIIAQAYAAPQFITFKDGKLGVNFLGFRAGVGYGGILGNGAGGGLYAEAGTPTGQLARAGLGGGVDENGRAAGGLYAGATAGNNVQASAGLAGGVNEQRAAGRGYATAQAGNQISSSRMEGQSSIEGSAGLSYSGTKNIAIKPVYKEFNTELKFDTANEVKPQSDLEFNHVIQKNFEVKSDVQPTVIVKEVYVEPPKRVIEKEIIHSHTKPHHHHFRKTAYIGGYIGGDAQAIGTSPVFTKAVEPQISKRVDVGAEGSFNGGVSAGAEANVNTDAGVSGVYTKQVSFQKNPTFFQDIFNIPISTLNAVGKFLSNTAANTNVSVQKTASFQAESDTLSPKYDQSLSSDKSSAAHLSIETPSASKLIDDVLAIPINTLGAVSRFLENNVPARKNVQVVDGEAVHARVRGPGRRRANKHVFIQEVKPESENA